MYAAHRKAIGPIHHKNHIAGTARYEFVKGEM